MVACNCRYNSVIITATHTCKLINESCRLLLLCVVILTGQSQLTVCKKLSGIELVLFLKVDFLQEKLAQLCMPHLKSFLSKVAFEKTTFNYKMQTNDKKTDAHKYSTHNFI